MKLSKFLLISSVVTGLVLLSRSLFLAPVRRTSDYADIDDASLDENSIRDLAQQIWESEGKPEGQAARHWAMATELLKTSLAEDAYSNTRHKHERNQSVAHDPYSYDKKSIH
jgi:hypothetical protein